jgi:hypothetical protein
MAKELKKGGKLIDEQKATLSNKKTTRNNYFFAGWVLRVIFIFFSGKDVSFVFDKNSPSDS